MFTHNLNPILIDFGIISIRWYSLAYIFGFLVGWWYGKKLIQHIFISNDYKFDLKDFDDLVTYLIISVIVGGRIGYILFYNIHYYISNPFDILKIWEGGMSFHGALVGVVLGTHIFALKKKIKTFFLLDIIACVSPIGIFFGRLANFINGELFGKVTTMPWGVIFPKIDYMPRHPSQLYEALLEGLVLFIILNFYIKRKNYKIGFCSSYFLIYYGVFRIISEFYREPDIQLGYLFNFLSMGSILSICMIIFGFFILNASKKNENKS